MHSHPHTQTSSIISGRFRFTVDGESRIVEAGDGVQPSTHAELQKSL